VSAAEQVDLKTISVEVSYGLGYAGYGTIYNCLDKVFAIREQWLNPYINSAWMSSFSSTIYQLPITYPLFSSEFTTNTDFGSGCLSNNDPYINELKLFLQPQSNYGVTPTGSLLVSSIYYQTVLTNVDYLILNYWYYSNS